LSISEALACVQGLAHFPVEFVFRFIGDYFGLEGDEV